MHSNKNSSSLPPELPSPSMPQPNPQIQSDFQGNKIKSLPTWVGIIVLLIFLVVFLLTGAWIFLPILIPFAIWYLRSYRRQQHILQVFAKNHGFTYQGPTSLNNLDGVIFQTPAYILGQATKASRGYPVNWLIHGTVANLNFRAYEYIYYEANGNPNFQEGAVGADAGKNSANFMVMDLNVPGEGLEFLLISKTNPTALNNINISLREYHLEGDFGEFFQLYAPQNAEIEILRIFTPDVMADLIDNYQNYNIELTPQHLFLYRAASGFAQTVENLEKMLQVATNLSIKFFAGIERVDFSKENIVTAALGTQANRSRIAGKFSLKAAIFISIVLTGVLSGIIYLVSEDNKIPQGYQKSVSAKVSEAKQLPCPPADNSCSPQYQITTVFTTSDGKSYWYSDILIRDYPIGSAIDIFYNPSNPAEAKFVGAKSSSAVVPIVIIFWLVAFSIVWITYYLSRKK